MFNSDRLMRFLRDIIVPLIAAIVIFTLAKATIGSFKVYGYSMLPTIQNGDYIIVNKAAYFFSPPQRGDIIVLESPRTNDPDLIKRIIALPGDTVEIKMDTVYVNNTPLVEPYIFEKPHYTFPPEKLPPDNYFVLGDNRNNSADSHTGWTLPRTNIVGKAWLDYWPPPRCRIIEHYNLNVVKQIIEPDNPIMTMKTLCPAK